MRENRKEKKGRRQRGELEVRKEDRLGGRSKREAVKMRRKGEVAARIEKCPVVLTNETST